MADLQTRVLSDNEHNADQGGLSRPFGAYAPGAIQRALIGLARATFLHRGKLRYRMSQLIYALGRPLDIMRMGCKFRVGNQHNLIEYGLLLHPGYNKPEIDFLSQPLGPDSVAVDIGSNIGLYSLPLAKTGARVISVDANPAMVAQLQFNMRASGFTDADAVNAAVGDADGMASLRIRRDDVAIVNIVPDQDGRVPMRRLDAILADLGVTRVDVLKIDIEGHEDKALGPYLNTMTGDMIPRRIVIERAGPEDYPICTAAFEKLGFTLAGRTRSNSMYVRPDA